MNNKLPLKVSLLIPTYNAGNIWPEVLESIDAQNFDFHRKLIVDSGSKDITVAMAKRHGFEVVSIDKSEFNHGTTRQLLADTADGSDIYLFLTQDAILASDQSVRQLVKAFDDERVGLAYGRQLPHKNATPLETHARLFNYPPQGVVRSYEEKEKLGFKVFFCSNSFAAYRATALDEVGGFPSDSIMGEDAIVAARLLLKNYQIAYVADATARHSHNYTFAQELRRYFDTRVFHEQNKWLIEHYGRPTGEGVRYLKSEIRYIASTAPAQLFKSFSSVWGKWLGYTLGKHYKRFPIQLLRKLSMHPGYWEHA